MSLVSEETPPGLLYLPTSSPQSVPTPQGDYSRPETTTASLSPPQQQAGGQKTGTVTGMVCAVCSEISSKDTTFRKHYGVICCEACKCFFRRTVQMSRDYKCRYDGRCTIGRFPEIMKQVCQACRFTQCLRAGMKIECKSLLLEAIMGYKISLTRTHFSVSFSPYLAPSFRSNFTNIIGNVAVCKG